MLDSITYSDKVFSMSIPMFLASIFLALALGIGTALVFQFRTKHTASMATTLAIMPPAIALVIMLVNGNIGAGLAVAGTFALVRFRSAPGSAKEITGLFISVAIGLACGMGYVGVALLFFALTALYVLLLGRFRFGEEGIKHRHLKITVPENADYETLFEDVLERYTSRHELTKVRTTNMGTLYELHYQIELKDPRHTREFIDELRCRNGNLNILCGREAERDVM
ncbi:MAG: DUF4956 domain-containing protein [Oscillospiraceae bacterium]|nr:DUF4956 domain-containing protein [Oscillospiraceae bacterium]